MDMRRQTLRPGADDGSRRVWTSLVLFLQRGITDPEGAALERAGTKEVLDSFFIELSNKAEGGRQHACCKAPAASQQYGMKSFCVHSMVMRSSRESPMQNRPRSSGLAMNYPLFTTMVFPLAVLS